MVDSISSQQPMPVGPGQSASGVRSVGRVADGTDFASQLRQQLEQVSQMQAEADEGIQNMLTGQTDNITEVFTTARKAEVAFSLLMEIRNKLVDAYTEMRQLRV